MTDHEADILSRYSTPGLRRNQFTREAKRDHLTGLKVTADERDKILSALYGHTDTELHLNEPKPVARTLTITGTRDGNAVIIKPTLDVASRPA